MNYGEIKPCDIANGIGVRVSLFVSGCRNCCKNCFNQMTWDFNYGQVFDTQKEQEVINLLAADYISGLTILGGEPLEPENQEGILNLVRRVKKEMPSKTIWIYSGFTFEELTGVIPSRSYTNITKDILSLIDVLVDGRFIEEQKDITLRFRGSRNQRVIDVPKTLEQREIITIRV